MIRTLLYCLILFLLLPFSGILAQQGKVDPSFNVFDDGQYGDGFDGTVRTLLLQRDGNLIVGGDYLSLNGSPVSYLTRLNPNGSIDESFNTGAGFNGKIYASYLQSDGKIILGGSFTSYNGISAGRLIRLNSDGSYDPTFNTSIGATTGIVYDIAMQSDGKIIIVGSFTKYANSTVNRVARLFPNGTLDSSLLTGSGSTLNITHVKITTDERIILTGNFITFNGTPANRIVRLNSNGSFDSTFNCGTGFNDDVNAIALQTDGKMVIGGNFTVFNDIVANRFIRLNADGTKDESFQVGLGFSKEGVQTIKIDSNGDLMIGGSFTGFYNGTEVNRVVFLNSDGTLKTNFDIGSGPASASVLSLEFDEEGSWFIGGSFSVFNGQNQGRLAKINSDGEHDIAYLSSGIGFDNSVLNILPLPNQKIIVGGNFNKFNGTAVSKITCLLEDGSIDTSFNTGKTGANYLVKTTVLQADGKIVIGGNFTKYNDILTNRIIRILSNGETDNSFNIGEGFNAQVYALAVQTDQKIIVAGAFTKYNGSTLNNSRVVRLLPDGTKDSNFNIGLGADGTIEAIVVQSDGKILLGGHFKTFNAQPFSGIVRLNPDGSIDSSFNIRNGFDKYVYAMALQSDQKIIVGGSFLTFDGISQKRIARLNTDGSLDATFESGAGFSKGDVRSILLQPDDRILVGGTFSGTYNNTVSYRIIRLMPSGVIDNSFTASLNNTLFDMKFTEEYRLLIGGNFNSVSGISKHRIARLKLCVNTTIWNGISWSNGPPSAGKDVYFKENFPQLTNATVCGCHIDQGKTVNLLEANTLAIEFQYTGLGTLILENSASLYQSDDDIVNTGIIHLIRKTKPVIRYDMTYWSSPVDRQTMRDFSPNTLGDKYYWHDPISRWVINYNGTMTMIPGQGYCIRAPQNYSITERQIFEGTFKGIPNNGKIDAEFKVADGFYLIGNPYPSAINADLFIKSNASKIYGALYFWTHSTPPSNGKYSADDCVVYNLLGGVGISSSLNSENYTTTPDGTIASGQGFFVQGKEEGSIQFNNSMRIKARNSSFFRPSISSKAETGNERLRFWLNLYNEKNALKQILLGYAQEASNVMDYYDAVSFGSNQEIDFYSILEDKKLVIQGKAMPWIESDSFNLGYKTTVKTTLKLEIDHQDILFNEIDIFLVDKTLNKFHNLSEGPYQFDSEAGTFNNRFSIVYYNKALGNGTFEDDFKSTLVYVKNQIINIQSFNENIKKITIFDISGNELYKKDKLETKKVFVQNLLSSHQVLLVKVTFQNGKSISKKVIF
ncbi:T9SS sorting signal type C domain-containing protein [Flavobacterium sp. HBTb2-11-1]|uniref:T9SS sorting signal type C domain-containing protein n=1 Tax=Flavobacterium sp. HBTb2-11-1 TaxID=2692212 RepID=UPI00136F9B53|nr:T9SS sorting signal type C domain-containing protein [Flavobacterium sp. HBTb2-11-1]MXO06315.1 T9SS sorting signal type C domain-containing protein [Flavobacterium sp. HBTb2-11-1]